MSLLIDTSQTTYTTPMLRDYSPSHDADPTLDTAQRDIVEFLATAFDRIRTGFRPEYTSDPELASALLRAADLLGDIHLQDYLSQSPICEVEAGSRIGVIKSLLGRDGGRLAYKLFYKKFEASKFDFGLSAEITVRPLIGRQDRFRLELDQSLRTPSRSQVRSQVYDGMTDQYIDVSSAIPLRALSLLIG